MAKRIVVFLAMLVVAVGIAFAGAYFVVVSQNPASAVTGSSTDYGPAE